MKKNPTNHRGNPVSKQKKITVRKHFSAEDLAALASVKEVKEVKNNWDGQPGSSGTGVVSQGSLAMCHNNDH